MLTNLKPDSFLKSSHLLLTRTVNKNFIALFFASLYVLRKSKFTEIIVHCHGFLGCLVGSLIFTYFKFMKIIYLRSDLLPRIVVVNHHHSVIAQSIFRHNHVPSFSLILDFLLRALCNYNLYTSNIVKNYGDKFRSKRVIFRGETIYPCVAKDFPSYIPKSAKFAFSIFFYARLSPQKDIKLYLDVCSHLIRNGIIQDAYLFVPNDQLYEFSLSIKQTNFDNLISARPDSDLTKFLVFSSTVPLHIVTSKYEPFGMTILELALSGIFSITPSYTGALEVVPSLRRYSYIRDFGSYEKTIELITSSLLSLSRDVNTYDKYIAAKDVLVQQANTVHRRYHNRFCEIWNNLCSQ